MLTALGDTALLAWSLPLIAVVLLFGVYFLLKIECRRDMSDR
ncbi:hypothetical protein [Labrenzia sp. VG12]|nr:hypothetical protein [Labrenzia sp. VG12]